MNSVLEMYESAETRRRYRVSSIKATAPSRREISYSGGSTNWASSMDASRTAARQMDAASQGEPFTAIRPVAVKVASQQAHVGQVSKSSSKSRGMQSKRHDLILKHFSPEFVRKDADSITVIENHPFLDSIRDPNPFMTQWALMYCTAFSMEATGEAIWVLDPRDNNLKIWYFPRHWITAVHTKDQVFVGWKLTPPGQPMADATPIPPELVVQFMTPDPANPTIGHSAMQSQSVAVSTDMEIQKAQLAMTRNITRPSMLIILDDMEAIGGGKSKRPELTDDQRDDVVESARRMYGGALKFGDPFILDGLIKDVKPYMPQLADLDYDKGSKLTKNRIMQGIGTNPLVAGQVEGGNRAQSVTANQNVNAMKVNPLLENMSQTATKKIAPLISNGSNLVIWWDRAEVLDAEMVVRRIAQASRIDVMTRGEWRYYLSTGRLDLPMRDDDDDLVGGVQQGASTGRPPGDSIKGGSIIVG